jgi:hypothetical protein
MVKFATNKQKAFMHNNGIKFAKNISSKDAWVKISRFKNFEAPSEIEMPKIEKNLASPKLIDYAKKLGIEVPVNITTQDLRELIDERGNA